MTSVLSATEIASMRSALETLLPDTCVYYSASITPDGQGGGTASWTAGGTVVCRLDHTGGNRETIGESVIPANTWLLTVPQGTHLNTQMQIVHNGLTYAISDVAAW